MAADHAKLHAARALELIALAFADRAPPSVMTDSKQLSDCEYEEVMSFEGRRWQDISFEQVQRSADAVFWFAPQAFCYYLPGIMAAGLKENRWESNAYDSLIGMLDRSPEPNFWDDFFLPRWTLLTLAEIEAVAAWAKWLEMVLPDAFYGNTYERVQETLRLLKERQSSVLRPDSLG
jgi:hypothetical protein